MSRWYEPTAEQLAAFEAWLVGRPPIVRELARRFPPWELLYLDPPGQRVWATAYAICSLWGWRS